MKIKLAIVDRRIPEECEGALRARGYRVITLPPSPRLLAPMASHTDMLLCKIGENFLTSADYAELALPSLSEIYDLTHHRMHLTSDIHGEDYPRDVLFNCLILGKRLFARLSSLSPYLKELAASLGYTLIDVNQGYPACTVLRLNDNAVITADPGMARILSSLGVRVYKIKEGGISLPPYEYGFIGGAAGVDGERVYFLGDISSHPSYDTILSACCAEGLTPVMLGGGAPLDLGGILFAEGDVN